MVTKVYGDTGVDKIVDGTITSSDFAAGANVISSGTSVSASGTSVDFTGIPSWVKRITVMLDKIASNGTPGNASFLIQLGDSGGIETTGYAGTGHYVSTGLVLFTSTSGIRISNGVLAGTLSGNFTITLQDSATNSWVTTGIWEAPSDGYGGFSAFSKSLSGTLDRVRITTINGTDTFNTGNINILYE